MFWIGTFLAAAGFWWLFRRYLGSRLSPKVLLFSCAPILALLLALQIAVPYLPNTSVPVVVSAQEPTVDLGIPLKSLDGADVKMEDSEATLIFLNFWATWCGPCRAEMPSMAKLYEELKSEGLEMVAVTDEDAETVNSYLADSDYPFRFLLDPRGDLFRNSQVIGLPTTLILDKKGRVLLNHVGAYMWDDPAVVAQVRTLLEK